MPCALTYPRLSRSAKRLRDDGSLLALMAKDIHHHGIAAISAKIEVAADLFSLRIQDAAALQFAERCVQFCR